MNTDTIAPITNYYNIINNNIIINDDNNFLVERWAHIDQRLRELYYGYYTEDQDQEQDQDQDQEQDQDQDQDQDQEQEQEQEQEQAEDTSLTIEWDEPSTIDSPTSAARLICQSPIPFNYRPFVEEAEQQTANYPRNESEHDTDSTLSLSGDERDATRE